MIFWKHVKGLSENNLFSFIRFRGNAESSLSTNVENLPRIFLSKNSNFDPSATATSSVQQDCGYILTSNMLEGSIAHSFTFYDKVTWNIENKKFILQFNDDANKWEFNANLPIKITCGIEVNGDFSTDGIISTTNDTDISYNEETVQDGALIVDGGARIAKKTYIGDELKVAKKTEALYFNAISDYRAKKDFKLLDIDALELIKKVQLYSFKYKESNQPSIGIIAQDVQDININGFELVDNKEASGANFDYMSIHESKLVYILWKAIQEQQKEIEELKKLIINQK